MIKRSLLISCFIFVLFALLDFVFNFISELENLSANYSFLYSLKFMLASMPYNANDFLEGACLLGVMIALGISHQEGNLNVLRSSGESPIKIVLLNAIGPMILVFSYLAANELVFRDIYINAEIEKNLRIDDQSSVQENNEWIKDKNSFINFSDKVGSTIYNVKFLEQAIVEGFFEHKRKLQQEQWFQKLCEYYWLHYLQEARHTSSVRNALVIEIQSGKKSVVEAAQEFTQSLFSKD